VDEEASGYGPSSGDGSDVQEGRPTEEPAWQVEVRRPEQDRVRQKKSGGKEVRGGQLLESRPDGPAPGPF